MKLNDISDKEVCEAVANYQRERTEFPYQILAKKFNCDEKLAFRACERACERGLIDFGVSLRTGWLTEKGRFILENNQ